MKNMQICMKNNMNMQKKKKIQYNVQHKIH